MRQAIHRSSPVSQVVDIHLEMTDDMPDLRLPEGLQERLQWLLDRQDSGTPLTAEERREAEGLVAVAELLSLLRIQAERTAG